MTVGLGQNDADTMMTEIDLTRAPFLQEILGRASRRRSLTAQQVERTRHRLHIIRSLKREIKQSIDAAFIERANGIIEQKKFEIEGILYEDHPDAAPLPS